MAAEPFHRFMQRALFDPQRGYYSRNIQTVGRHGDFSTSATLSPLLGQGIAHWLKSTLTTHPNIRSIIEVGAGSGQLMRQIRQTLGWRTRRRLRWHIVETSPSLKAQQQNLLPASSIHWHTQLEEALQASDGHALIYHNELLDAFPCRLLQKTPTTWQELWLHFSPTGHVTEELCDCEPMPWASALSTDTFPIGQRIEVHASIRDWLTAWTPHWKSGQMLTIDYGDTSPALYHRRPHGTLRGYFMQHRVEGPALYQNIGRQDLTADINFTDYRTWTRDLGLHETFYDTQSTFLQSQNVTPKTHADHHLLHPDGPGTAFKVVVHARS
jgi:SAM-dependent MidA family methyltransferase